MKIVDEVVASRADIKRAADALAQGRFEPPRQVFCYDETVQDYLIKDMGAGWADPPKLTDMFPGLWNKRNKNEDSPSRHGNAAR